MKVLLINPGKIEGGSVSPNIGLLYLASYLRENNVDVDVLDLQVESFKLKKDYDVIGLTTKTPSIFEVWDLAKKIKELQPNCKIVLGGNHVSYLPEESLKKEFVDIVVRKEGEISFYELVSAIEKNKPLRDIKGISYKQGNKIKHNQDRDYIQNLDSLPFPAYDLVDLNKYKGVQSYRGKKKGINIITSRGCPYNCNFCYKATFGNKWRGRSPENVMEEIEYYKNKFDIKEIGIWDDLFNFNIERALKICELFKKRNFDMTWCLPNGIRVDNANYDLLKLMKECGCSRITYGIEHGSQEILNKIGKGITLQQIKEACKKAKELKYTITGCFIFGNLFETKRTMQETIDLACSLPIDYASFQITTPYPGSKLYEDLIKSGKLKDLDWSMLRHKQYGCKAYFETDNFTKKDVELFYKKAWKKFYLRPKMITKILLRKDTYLNIKPILFRAKKELLG